MMGWLTRKTTALATGLGLASQLLAPPAMAQAPSAKISSQGVSASPAALAAGAAEDSPALIMRTAGQPDRRVKLVKQTSFPNGDSLAEVKDVVTGQTFTMPGKMVAMMAKVGSTQSAMTPNAPPLTTAPSLVPTQTTTQISKPPATERPLFQPNTPPAVVTKPAPAPTAVANTPKVIAPATCTEATVTQVKETCSEAMPQCPSETKATKCVESCPNEKPTSVTCSIPQPMPAATTNPITPVATVPTVPAIATGTPTAVTLISTLPTPNTPRVAAFSPVESSRWRPLGTAPAVVKPVPQPTAAPAPVISPTGDRWSPVKNPLPPG